MLGRVGKSPGMARSEAAPSGVQAGEPLKVPEGRMGLAEPMCRMDVQGEDEPRR